MKEEARKIRYKLLPHTADICIEVSAASITGLFQNAAAAVLEQMVESGKTGDTVVRQISLQASGRDLLFIAWLQEILYEFYVHGLMYAGSTIEHMRATGLKAAVMFRRFDPKQHTAKREIKAITYHNIHIRKTGSRYTVRFVADI
jgi:SHS2 domain-containing protein